ncbi:MAG TPA: cytochrome oxidase subunit III [Saprospirales bacterium]|nr:cytochrome oxidase subunit III [Saprospirales bacterium]
MAALRQEYNQSKIHPHKLALWVAIGSIIMMFGAFTSAYVVRRAAGNWLEFKLPDVFMVSTVIILLSSVTIHLAFSGFKQGKEQQYKGMLIATFVLGLAFVVMQYVGWEALNNMGATFTVNPSSSFIYVISGLHAAHVLGGIGALTVALTHAFILPFKPTLRRKQRFDLVVQYWHFVDILWVYLMVFFMLQS